MWMKYKGCKKVSEQIKMKAEEVDIYSGVYKSDFIEPHIAKLFIS